MSGYTHAAVAANTIWISLLAGPVDERFLPLLIVGTVAGLLPDMDASESKIHHASKGFTRVGSLMFTHRGVTHTMWAALFFTLLSFLLFNFHPMVPLIVFSGYMSHLLLDMLNKSGVRILLPMKKKFRLVPRWMGFKVGGSLDFVLMYVSIIGILAFFLTQVFPYYNLNLESLLLNI